MLIFFFFKKKKKKKKNCFKRIIRLYYNKYNNKGKKLNIH